MEIRTRVAFEAELERRRDGPALAFDEIAAVDLAVLAHDVDTHSAAAAFEAVIDVAGDTPVGRRAITRRTGRETFRCGHLARQVHVTRRRAAAIVRTRRALGDLDLFGVEGVARDRPQIADAVDDNGSLRIETTHEDRIAGGRVAVLSQQ